MAPRVPGITERIDFVYRQLIDPCDAPITIWIEKMWPALWGLAVAWFWQFDIKQIIISWVRPWRAWRGLRSRRHMSLGLKNKRNRLVRIFGNIIEFDVSEWIGKHLFGGEIIRARQISETAAALWVLEGVLERFFYWYMILDLGTEFLFRWTSAVSETAYCRARDDAIFLGNTTNYTLVGIFDWDPIQWGTPVKMRNISFYNGFAVSCIYPGGVAAFAGTFTANPLIPSAYVIMRIRCIAGPSIGRESSYQAFNVDGESIDAQVFQDFQQGDTMICEVKVDGLWTMDAWFNFHAPSPNPYTP